MIKRLFLILLIGAGIVEGSAQKGVTTFGVQVKPMIPSKFFSAGPETVTSDYLTVDFIPRLGLNFGMLVRKGFTDMFSLETGINMVRRVYNMKSLDTVNGYELELKYRLTGYEVPVQGLIYVKLGDHLWMNASGGFSIDTYPSNLFSATSSSQDTVYFDLEQRTYRKHWVQLSLLANYGFEYRTKDQGYWYLGASYHRPFTDIATTRATYIVDRVPLSVENDLSGSYLTIDIRYFFHEDPERALRRRSP